MNLHMNTSQSTIFASVLTLGLFHGVAAADYQFSFSGTVSDDHGSTGLTGSVFTINMFVQDLAADLTAGGNMGSYRIALAQIDIGSNGSIEESFSPSLMSDAVYIDAGSTQLVGAFDITPGGAATFLFGVNLPGDAFDDPHSLSGQSGFTLLGLTSSSFSFYQSAGLDIELDVTSFTFSNTVVAPVPLPAGGIAGLGMLGALGLYRRARS